MKFWSLIISILIAQAAGLIGSLATAVGVRTWYVSLNKPNWNPPNWVFGPVWLALYTLMGIAAWLIWQQKKKAVAKTALGVYGVHLVFNALWSILFFGSQNLGLAFGEILILLGLIVTLIFLFGKINLWASRLLLPYLAWVSFAAYLNYTLWQLN